MYLAVQKYNNIESSRFCLQSYVSKCGLRVSSSVLCKEDNSRQKNLLNCVSLCMPVHFEHTLTRRFTKEVSSFDVYKVNLF